MTRARARGGEDPDDGFRLQLSSGQGSGPPASHVEGQTEATAGKP
jgi:hypothetical protein